MDDRDLFDGLDESALQPNAKMCFCCGINNASGLRIRFFADGPEAVLARVMLDDRFQGFPGIAHGGITATMLDEITGRATLSVDPNRLMYTAKLEVRYRQPIPLYKMLTLRGRIEKDRGRMVVAVGEIALPNGEIAAEATATLFAIPPETLKEMDTEEAGWQVYPLEQEQDKRG